MVQGPDRARSRARARPCGIRRRARPGSGDGGGHGIDRPEPEFGGPHLHAADRGPRADGGAGPVCVGDRVLPARQSLTEEEHGRGVRPRPRSRLLGRPREERGAGWRRPKWGMEVRDVVEHA